jgi:hypothetical protein
MAHLVIEMDRGMGWEVRSQGDANGVDAAALVEYLPAFAIQYPHRAFLDGVLVAEAQRPHGRRGKVVVVKIAHEARDDAY